MENKIVPTIEDVVRLKELMETNIYDHSLSEVLTIEKELKKIDTSTGLGQIAHQLYKKFCKKERKKHFKLITNS